MSARLWRLLPQTLRAQVLVLAALSALLLSASLAIPQGLMLAQKDSDLTDQALSLTAEDWKHTLRALAPQLMAQAQALGRQLPTGAPTEPPTLARLLKPAPGQAMHLLRLDLLAPDGRLLASSEAGAQRPLQDIALLRALHQRQTEVFGLVRRVPESGDAVPSAGLEPVLNLMAAQPLPDGRWLLLAADLGTLAQAFDSPTAHEPAYALSSIARIGQPAQNLIRSPHHPLPTDASDWPQHEGLSQLEHEASHWRICTVNVTDLGGYPVARWHRASLVTTQQQASSWLLALGLTGSLTLLLLLGLGLYAVLGRFLAPVEGATQALHALAQGDLYSAPLQAGGSHEVAQLAQAVEVFRAQALTLARRDFETALQHTRHRRLIERQLQRLGESLSVASPAPTPAGDGNPDGQLAGAFEQMSDRVIAHQQQLQNLLNERTRDLATVRQALQEREQLQRLRQDMEVARDLQLSHLPRPAALAPVADRVQVQATMQPAKEVGGDLYDFHLLDPQRLLLVVGDASGKGVPAAMFAMMARVLLRAAATQGRSPGACLALVNDALAQNNEAMLFCTVFLGVLDLKTGRLRYANAGHNPPWVMGRQGNEGRQARLDAASGLVLGALAGQDYDEAECQLQAHDELVMYSDGITEAHNLHGDLFSEARLVQAAAQSAQTPEALARHILDAVEAHMEGCEPFDDITLLILRYQAGSALA
jgi:sigma-B regulation protein RsbU (phosphoserine phosphatase)